MKMVRAIIRPEREEEVAKKLEEKGIYPLTKMDVLGRGRQKGLQVGGASYDELAKVMLMLVVEDGDVLKVLEAVMEGARTGNYGDGKIFITEVLETYTIRTGEKGL